MDWAAQVDAYCERTDFGFWAEPVNAVTNLGYLIVALWYLRAMRGVPLGRTLALLLLAIAVGSFLFHTLATGWAGLADSLPIALFVLVFIYSVNRHVLDWSRRISALGVLAFVPFAAAVAALIRDVPFFEVSSVYWAVPVAMWGYAAVFRHRRGPIWPALTLAGAVLTLSISVRSVDLAMCPAVPVGTHFLWHLLNAAMFVIVLGGYRAQMLAAPAVQR